MLHSLLIRRKHNSDIVNQLKPMKAYLFFFRNDILIYVHAFVNTCRERLFTSICRSRKNWTNLPCSKHALPSLPKKYSSRPPLSTEPETLSPKRSPSLWRVPCLCCVRIKAITFLNSSLSISLFQIHQLRNVTNCCTK